MRTLAEAPLHIKDMPLKTNPTPKATDEKGNPKHWVRKRIEKQQQQQQRFIEGPQSPSTPRVPPTPPQASGSFNHSPGDEPSSPSRGRGYSSPSSPTSSCNDFSPVRSTVACLPDVIDEAWLVQYTGITSLEEVDRLDLRMDTSETSVDPIGALLPSLRTLNLSHSRVASIRDLGTSLAHLKILELSDCGITDLDGIAALSGLQELHLSRNSISELTPLALHDNLQFLDLSSNRVGDIQSIEVLGSCGQLHNLSLSHNPIWQVGNYRRIVGTSIPHLNLLDGRKLTAEERTTLSDEQLEEAFQALRTLRVTSEEEKGDWEEGEKKECDLAATPRPSDPESKLTQDQTFFAGNPSSIRQRKRPQQGGWTGTILEVLDNPDADIDITSLPPQEGASSDWRLDEMVQGNQRLADLYNNMLSASSTGSKSTAGLPSSLESHEVTKGRRFRPHQHQHRSPGRTMETQDSSKGKRQEQSHDSVRRSQSVQGLGATKKDVLEEKWRGDESLLGRAPGGLMDDPPFDLELPVPVRIERRNKGGLLNVDDQRRLRRRWSGVDMAHPTAAGTSEGGSTDTSSSDSSDQEAGVRTATARRVTGRHHVLSTRQASEAQKAGVRLGFNLQESLAAIDQWADEIDQKDGDDGHVMVIAHHPDLVAKHQAFKKPKKKLASSTPMSAPKVSKSTSSKNNPRLATKGTGEPIHFTSTKASSQKETSSPPRRRPSQPEALVRATGLDDHTLIDLLRRPPKSVPQLRTREAFRSFFAGLRATKMEGLLCQAFADRDADEMTEKVKKRMDLVRDLLVM